MSPVNVSTIGAYIRDQREQAKISLRQLAQAAGVSNPYLSQIERGLRRPSADILQQIAKGLRISAEALYVEAGFLEDRPAGPAVLEAVRTDPELTERQKQMLIEIYESFRKEAAMAAAEAAAAEADDESGLLVDEAAVSWPEDLEPEPPAGSAAGPHSPETAVGESLAAAAAADAAAQDPWAAAAEPAEDSAAAWSEALADAGTVSAPPAETDAASPAAPGAFAPPETDAPAASEPGGQDEADHPFPTFPDAR
ncbi:MAG: helix-turn-helix domain-containing protein [Streptosporangiaceae bacterium]|jgi:transcriptional regulator with XRE-family HTH domain